MTSDIKLNAIMRLIMEIVAIYLLNAQATSAGVTKICFYKVCRLR